MISFLFSCLKKKNHKTALYVRFLCLRFFFQNYFEKKFKEVRKCHSFIFKRFDVISIFKSIKFLSSNHYYLIISNNKTKNAIIKNVLVESFSEHF